MGSNIIWDFSSAHTRTKNVRGSGLIQYFLGFSGLKIKSLSRKTAAKQLVRVIFLMLCFGSTIDLLEWDRLFDDRANLAQLLVVPNVQVSQDGIQNSKTPRGADLCRGLSYVDTWNGAMMLLEETGLFHNCLCKLFLCCVFPNLSAIEAIVS